MSDNVKDVRRRRVLKAGAMLGAGVAAPSLLLPRLSWAAGEPPIGTWPAGSEGSSVYIGAAVPLTGAYAAQGADELKGMQLAVEHINEGHPLIKKIAPKSKKGVLGKEVKLVYADSAAKPNQAVQAQQRFISENKVVLMTGSTSSAVAVALNKLAQREKVLYVA
ncbi:MAG: ABC transporter substrate-binding protein, partial [Burkholderiales bacterium]